MFTLETPRLLLRDMVLEDAEAFSAYNEDPEYYRYLVQVSTKQSTKEFVKNAIEQNAILPRRHFYLAIVEKESGKVIGDIVLGANKKYPDHMAGVGYGMNPQYWNNGYISEALKVVTEFGHNEMGYHRIDSGADAQNIGSCRTLEKCGYKKEGSLAYVAKVRDGWSEETFQYASIRVDKLK